MLHFADQGVVDIPDGAAAQVNGVGPGAAGGELALVRHRPGHGGRLAALAGGGNLDGGHDQVGGRRLVDDDRQRARQGVVVLALLVDLAARENGRFRDRVGDDDNVIWPGDAARQLEGIADGVMVVDRVAVAGQGADMRFRTEKDIAVRIQMLIHGQVDQVGPFRLGRGVRRRIHRRGQGRRRTGIGDGVSHRQGLVLDRLLRHGDGGNLEIWQGGGQHGQSRGGDIIPFVLELQDGARAIAARSPIVVGVDQDVVVPGNAIGQRDIGSYRIRIVQIQDGAVPEIAQEIGLVGVERRVARQVHAIVPRCR